MTKTILSIDCGTQSLRTLLFDLQGNLLAKQKIEYTPYHSPKPGWAEQNPNVFWNALTEGTQKLKNQHPEWFNAIVGIGVTTQRDSMVNLDTQGNPLRPVITWLDQRKAKTFFKPNPIMQQAYKIVGMNESVLKLQMEGKCNWIMQNEPDIWKNTHKYVQVSGYLNYKLTGNFKDSIASQIGHIPFDYKKRHWAAKKELSAKLFPIHRSKLVELVQPGQKIGEISDKAAHETGLKPGTPVIAAGSDKGCETVGMGVIDGTMASLSFGTTATVQTTSKKYFEPLKFMPAYPAPIPGYYNPEIEIFRGYWMITWFKNEFGYKEALDAEKEGVIPELKLNKMLEQVPPGSMGLVVQPHWSPGLKFPCAKGAMVGFGDVHTRAYVYRAIIEGLAYALLDGLHKIEKAGKIKVKKVAVSGGASQSDEICQISADVFGLELVRGQTFETSGLGAAIITAVGVGEYPDFEQAIKAMVKYKKSFKPNPENQKIYKQLYEKVYQKLFPQLRKTYNQIREIVNYPEIIK